MRVFEQKDAEQWYTTVLHRRLSVNPHNVAKDSVQVLWGFATSQGRKFSRLASKAAGISPSEVTSFAYEP